MTRRRMPGPHHALALTVLAFLTPALAGAQALGSSRVSTGTATIHARCDPSSPARAVLRKGDAVTIESVNEGWVSVRVEASGERGCLRRSELEPTPSIEHAADARRAHEIEHARG